MRQVKFRGKRKDTGDWVYGSYHNCVGNPSLRDGSKNVDKSICCHWILTHDIPDTMGWTIRDTYRAYSVIPETVGQFIDLPDKNGIEIYEGDVVRVRTPYRSTQTHFGDNIPNGQYTEPMEPEIKTLVLDVKFDNGTFWLEGEDGAKDFKWPISWEDRIWDEESIKDAIGFRGHDMEMWDDPEEGDLSYLLKTYKLKDIQELIVYLNGIEIIGNIHENPELLK